MTLRFSGLALLLPTLLAAWLNGCVPVTEDQLPTRLGDDDATAGDDDTPGGDDDASQPGDDDSSPSSDTDQDGYSATQGDCDDTDPKVHPGAPELCDGKDNNCDGQTDNGATTTTYYVDQDLDGYGLDGTAVTGCKPASGYSELGGDCDDADASIHQGATESCNDRDDDCDGATDEALQKDFYPDEDGDGHGSGDAIPTVDCAPPDLFYVADNTDCDDGDPVTYAGATELCDGLDNSCEGQIDEGLPQIELYIDADGDSYGAGPSSSNGCNGTPFLSANNLDCDDGDALVYPNAPERCNTRDDNCNGAADEDVSQSAFYPDQDNDGHGQDDAAATYACAEPPGSASSHDDCNDADPAVYAGARELCDAKDNDCNDQIDDQLTFLSWYLDLDDDGYGQLAHSLIDCTEPPGYSAQSGDCDDTDAAVNPGAFDAFDDGRDSNCNGLQDWITLVAGNGSSTFSGDGGQATAAGFTYPTGMAVDGTGVIFVADQNNQRVRRIDTDGVVSTVAGTGAAGSEGDGGPATLAQLSTPQGVVVDAAGNLFIADTSNNKIRRVDSAGVITTIAGTGKTTGNIGDGKPATAATLIGPAALAISPAGLLYIADTKHYRIRKIGQDGNISTVAGNGSNGFSGDGGQATIAQISSCYGVAFDAEGNLIIGDTFNNRVRRVDLTGTISTVAGNGNVGSATAVGDKGPATDAELHFPSGVTVDSQGEIFIADNLHDRIRIVDTEGMIDTVVGTGTSSYGGDNGPATNARSGATFSVTLDELGNLLLSDISNNRVRRVTW